MLEIACFEMSSAETALQAMADRIEFCADRLAGGTTPDYYEFLHLKRNFQKPIYVMIRPKPGPFYYSEEEFSLMKDSIINFKNSGADGFVFGILDGHHEIDVERNKTLVELAGSIPCTFHRAIDRTPNIESSIEKLIEIGFTNVLTSGGKETAVEGKEMLRKLIQKFGKSIHILVGGGVRSDNIEMLKSYTGAEHFHSSGILKYDTFPDSEEIKGMKKLIS